MSQPARRTSARHQAATAQQELRQHQTPPGTGDARANPDTPTPTPVDQTNDLSDDNSTLGKRPRSPETPANHRPAPPNAMDIEEDPEPSTPTQPTFTSAFATPNPYAALHPDTPTPSAGSATPAAPSVQDLREQLDATAETPSPPHVEGLAASMHAPTTPVAQGRTTERISRIIVEEDDTPDPFPAFTPPFRIPQPSPAPATAPLYPAQAWEGVVNSQVEAWLASPEGESLLLRTFGTTAHLANNQQLTVKNIGKVLTAYMGIANPQIFPPIPSEAARTSGRLPKVFLIRGLSADDAAAILAGYVFSTPLVTFQALPLDPQIPLLIFAVGGFLDTATEADVLATVIETWNKPVTLTFLADLMDDTMTTEKPLTVTQLHPFLSSVEAKLVPIKASDTHPTPRFSIVTKRMTLVDDTHWFKIVEHFKSLHYPSNFHGTGRAMRSMFCPLCNGCDHPRGLCGFPDLTGWNGEGHDAPQPPTNAGPGEDPNQDRRRRNRGPYNPTQRGPRA
ncbi:hypothetical protein FA95DRAFT_1609043 [Auriscalpium vulgare]|uniref:Uncharacterized protein n=1 Tax=Auriscalpium vulgare TaxID=40419 RepID=A0ACB8RIZ7_9AGAM|nr:hypothetical protein FA95DRAFT_1609043 [Auriscalpium vulgare]